MTPYVVGGFMPPYVVGGFVIPYVVGGFVIPYVVGGFIIPYVVGGFVIPYVVGGFVIPYVVGGFVIPQPIYTFTYKNIVLKYQSRIPRPHTIDIKDAKAINGPKGIACPLFLILLINKITDIIPPTTKDKNKVNTVYLIPNNNPNAPISFISPPPMAPFVTTAIKRSIPPPRNIDNSGERRRESDWLLKDWYV